jgi:hypothetical protein
MKNLSLSKLIDKLMELLETGKRYAPLIFCVFIALIYIFIVYRVQVLNNAEPNDTDVTNQSRTAQVPHIDPKVLDQLQSLQDNSVSVQALFDEARANPFQE